MTSRDEHERAIFLRALNLPGGLDDPRHPFDTERFLEGFTVEEHRHPVDPDSPLGRAMAEARASWGEAGTPDPESFVRPEPIAVDE